ncbi:hydrophobic surface binding protein A-domain-containing protein [Jackrogersella minutella]|nr:hydrophobic surface binding protein A-domain-containing protein [Jackrogersella minutella]
MKPSTLFTLALAAVGVSADLVPAEPPTKVKRDIATVTSVVAQVSAAITKLDTSVKAFTGDDLSGVKADAQALVSALTSGASTLASAGGTLSLSDALDLQSAVTPLGPAAQALVQDVTAQKSKFEQAAACSVIGGVVQDAGKAAKSLVDDVVAQVPTEAQDIAQQAASNIVTTLTSLTSEFTADNCTDAAGASSSAAAAAVSSTTTTAAAAVFQTSSADAVAASASSTAKEVAAEGAVTVTVTAPCACSQAATSSAVVVLSSTPAFAANSTVLPTGTGALTAKPSPSQSIVTAGAVAHGVASGSVGFVAALAAMLLI